MIMKKLSRFNLIQMRARGKPATTTALRREDIACAAAGIVRPRPRAAPHRSHLLDRPLRRALHGRGGPPRPGGSGGLSVC